MTAPAFNLATVQALVAHYATLQGLTAGGWTFTCEIVPGLTHNGEPAWATVVSDPAAKTASIKVRDLVQTPIDGVSDPWTELKVTISHELWHPWVTWLLANPTEDAEEALVEAAAQAVVRSAGEDARIMARGVRRSLTGVLIDAPAAVRARVAKRISARAVTRARGGQMDPKLIMEALEALIAGDAEKCQEILKGLIASAAGAAPVEESPESMNEPPVDGREEQQTMAEPTKPAPGGPPAPKPMPRAAVSEHEARARKAADSLVSVTVRARIREERTNGLTLPAATEQSMLKMTDLDRFEERIADIKAGAGLQVADTRARGEGPAKPLGTPPPGNASKYRVETLISEGINPIMAKSIADEKDPAAADLAYNAARARIVGSKSPWPTKGGAA